MSSFAITRNSFSLLFFFYFLEKCSSIEHDFKGFDDSVLFGISWPGSDQELGNLIPENNEDFKKNAESIKVTTHNKETYECYLPDIVVPKPKSVEGYDGPTPLQLLKPLFSQKICSYRLESYWSYEVCHGRYIRQYHEEREGKQIKSQEYYLGHWSAEQQKELEALMTSPEYQSKPKYTKIDGLTLAYVELEMGDGEVCDLTGKPRVTRVQYVCYTHGKHEIYSFKEVASCEYEIMVLSPLLCAHPQFKPQEITENTINCLPIGDAPKKPRSLLASEAESLKFHHQTTRLTTDRDHGNDVVAAVLKVEKIEKDGETHLKFELRPLHEDQRSESEIVSSFEERTMKPITDDSPVRAFLNGENCLNGGSGWWKYEFCYGKYVEQYHVDRSGVRTTVLLGKFDERAHLAWIRDNKSKAPKPLGQRTYISHFYSDGDVCDKTGKPRQTEVKLKCLENSSNSAQVSLYLLEPKTCQYILGVESPLICDILPLADENGLVKESIPLLSAVREMIKEEKSLKEEPSQEKQSDEESEND